MNTTRNWAKDRGLKVPDHHRASLACLFVALVGALPLNTAAAPNAATLAFEPPVAYDTGGENRDLQIADLNRDGKLDLVVAVNDPSGEGFISVLGGRGDGTFDQAMATPAGQQLVSLAVADLNRDGRQDVVAGRHDSLNRLSVLLGRGDGRLLASVDYDAGPGVPLVAVGDVNRDGRPDLVSTSYESGNPGVPYSINVLIGCGDGTFRPLVSYPTDDLPASGATIADFNRDGKPDVVSNTSLLLGRGNGGFQPYADWALGYSGNGAVAVGDVNRDGKLDLALGLSLTDLPARPHYSLIGVFLGRGDGSFREPRTYYVTNPARWLTIADVNGDGRPDLVTANQGPDDPSQPAPSISVLLGRRNGTLQRPHGFALLGSGCGAVQTADLNQDGKLDVVGMGDRVYVLLNDGP